MATNKSVKRRKDLSSRLHAFLKAYAKGKTLKPAAIEAGYSKKNADQSGYQALKAIKGRAADLIGEIGLTDRALIENYLGPLLEATETKFVHDRWNSLSERLRTTITRAIMGGFVHGRDAFLSSAIGAFHFASSRSYGSAYPFTISPAQCCFCPLKCFLSFSPDIP